MSRLTFSSLSILFVTAAFSASPFPLSSVIGASAMRIGYNNNNNNNSNNNNSNNNNNTFIYRSYNNPDCTGGVVPNSTLTLVPDQCAEVPTAMGTSVTISNVIPNSDTALCVAVGAYVTNNNDCTPDAAGEVSLIPAMCGVCQSDGYRQWLFTCPQQQQQQQQDGVGGDNSIIYQTGVPSEGTGECVSSSSSSSHNNATCVGCTATPLKLRQCLVTPQYSGPMSAAAMMATAVGPCGGDGDGGNDQSAASGVSGGGGVVTLTLSQALGSVSSPCLGEKAKTNIVSVQSAPLGQCVNGVMITLQ